MNRIKTLIALLLVLALFASNLHGVLVYGADMFATTSETEEETQARERIAAEDGVALNQSVTVDGVTVRLVAAPGVFPEGASLFVTRAGAMETRVAEAAVASQREEGRNVAASYTFDVKVVDQAGNELQPTDERLVQLSFALAEVENQNLEAQVYHLTEDMPGELSAQELDVQTLGNIATVQTDGFSFYTVEFTYEDKEYVLQGGRYVRLYDILNFIGLTGEVESWEISNNALFTILKGDETGICEESEWIGDDEIVTPVDDPNGTVLYLLSLQAFDTEEWLKVTIDGIEYEIVVTDDNITQNVPAPYTGTVETNCDNNPSVTNDTYYTTADKPDNIKQSQSQTSATDFAAGLPLSTIFIDTSKIGHSDNKGVRGEFTLLTEDPTIMAGFEHSYSTADGDLVSYNPTLNTSLKQIAPNTINYLNGDLFQFIYEDAAILPNGERANLKIVYSNARIAIDQRLGITDIGTGLTPSNYQGAIYLARGGSVTRGGTDTRYLGTNKNPPTGNISDSLGPYTNPFTQDQREVMQSAVDNTINAGWGATFSKSNANSAATPALGHSIDVKYQVVDDNGDPVNGTFIFAVTGINLDRDPYTETGNNICKPLWDYTTQNPGIHFYSEAMSINQGVVSDYIYVRPNTAVLEDTSWDPNNDKLKWFYAQVVKDENGNPKFIGNNYGPANLGGNDRSYNAGCVFLANATEGIAVTITGHANTRDGMNTQAYGGVQIWYRYTSFSGPNGTIQTTSEGNYGGTLNDTSDSGVKANILDPNTYVVPEGKTVSYTMTPNDGFQIAKLEVGNGQTLVPRIYNGQPLSTMKDGDVLKFDDAAGRECTLTAVDDGGKIKFILVMPYAKHDEVIHVYWERTQAKVTVKKETEDDKEGSFQFRIRAQKKENQVFYAPVQVGSVFVNPNTGEYDQTLVTGASCTKNADELAELLSGITLMEVIALPSELYNYDWGASLWKTNFRLSDLGISYGDKDDVLFVGFINVPSAQAGDTLDIALNTGYSAAGPERVYFFHPTTTIEEDVVTYWNFETGEEQSEDPGWHEFTLNNGAEMEFLIRQKYEYEVNEKTPTGWELVSVDGVVGADKAIGYLAEETHSAPEHVFRNRRLPDLKIEKTTEKNAPGSFEFIVELNQAALPAQEYQVQAEAKVENGVISYSFTNSGPAFAMDGVAIPAGSFVYVAETLPDSVFDQLLALTADNGPKNFPVGTDKEGTVSTNAIDSLKSLAEERQREQIASLDAGQGPGEPGQWSVTYIVTAPGKAAGPYVMNPLPTGVVPVDDRDLSKGYRVTVSSGTPFTFTDLPYGVSYEVVETLPSNWQQLSTINDSALSLTDDATAGFLNRRFLELTVSKTLVGNHASRDKYFKFTVKLQGCVPDSYLTLDMSNASLSPSQNAATVYSADTMVAANTVDQNNTTGGQQILLDGEGEAEFVVYLQHGQSILLKGIPYGASYTVTEASEDYRPILGLDGDDHTGDSATVSGTEILLGTYNGEPGAFDSCLREDTTLNIRNVRDGVVPTGTETGSPTAPGMILLLSGMLCSLLWIGRRRLDYD